MQVNSLREIMQDGFLRGSNKNILGFIFSSILWCFAYGMLIINYLAIRIMGEHYLLLHSMKVPLLLEWFFLTQMAETEATSLAISLRIFLIFVLLLPIKSLKQIKSEGETPEYSDFLQKLNNSIACYFSSDLKSTITSKRRKSFYSCLYTIS